MRSIVLDNGSGTCKAGFGGASMPAIEFPTIIAEPKHKNLMMESNKQYFFGDEAQKKRGISNIRYPVRHGIVSNWDDMQAIWGHILYKELGISPCDFPILITDTPLNPKTNREKMAKIFFESFDCPALYISIQAVLAMYSIGLTTGLVIDSGDGVTHTVPIYDGYSLPHAVKRMDIAGRDLTEYLIHLMAETGLNFRSSSEKEIARDIKEKLCFVALDFNKELNNLQDDITLPYELPDGQIIRINKERFRAPELLFQPSLNGLQIGGIHEVVNETIKKCDIDMRQSLYSNILLSGGSTLFAGMKDRMQKELQICAKKSTVEVYGPPDRKYSVWLGGSLLSTLSTFENMWISRKEYDEHGAQIVHRKCR